MISRHDLERLLDRESNGNPVLSLFLDLSVNSDNKRTHHIFINQRRAQFDELDSEKWHQPREGVGEAFSRIDEWLENDFREENHGAVLYFEIGGDWFEALQFPVAVPNRMVVADRPTIGPLAQVIESYHHHGVILLDRERVRLLSVYLGTLMDEIVVEGDPLPAAHDIQAGGYSQMRYQRRKLEEQRHFFREFAKEVEVFVRRYRPDDLIILGTEENVARFREFLSDPLREMVVFTGGMSVGEPASEILARLEPHLEELRERESRESVEELRQRVGEDYLAAAGFQRTLAALQEGRVDTLIVAPDSEREGTRCSRCGFVFAEGVERCPFDEAPVEGGVDLVEEAIRIAKEQGAEVTFADAGQLGAMAGVGALLRF